MNKKRQLPFPAELLRMADFFAYLGELVNLNSIGAFELTPEQKECIVGEPEPVEKEYLDNGYEVIRRFRDIVVARSPEGVAYKTCIDCGELLPISAFFYTQKGIAHSMPRCKKCYAKGYAAPDDLIVCRKCGKTKPAREFSVSKYNKSGRQSYCRECTAALKRTNWEVANEH